MRTTLRKPTIGEIRKMIQAERAKDQAIIDRAAQR